MRFRSCATAVAVLALGMSAAVFPITHFANPALAAAGGNGGGAGNGNGRGRGKWHW